ncbi:methyltransferase domain-containing protein [Terasakiella sp. A23]|uniref:class I SAM-dependent methyltransferase n=1 Tax=Terasakiella sp. FCG-A23 TaxID=3080561 RepID=UPI002955985D|nr:methyltransferase domain-containing protein [Terasakiella sp. A23]MDV7341119.1 methyltransferase domain-containing protein [Terasakiella sp. A23]
MNRVIEHWNKKYEGNDLVFGSTPNEFLTTQTHHLANGGRILAVGDGEGRNGIWLAEQGFEVLSVDGAQNGVRKATEQAKLKNISPIFQGVCADLLEWDWPETAFDGVACLHLYFPPQERRHMHNQMMRSLKKGGHLILEVFHPNNVGRDCGGPKIKELCYTADDLKIDFSPYDILLLEETEREVKQSSFHNGGLGYVTRCVARK